MTPLFAKKLDTITFASDIKIETNTAIPKLENPKLAFPTTYDVIWSMNPLITMLNKPNVISVIGSDNSTKKGLIAAFKIANTKLASNAIQTFATWKLDWKNPAMAMNKIVFIKIRFQKPTGLSLH